MIDALADRATQASARGRGLLAWKIKRLRTMSPAEVIYRVWQAARVRIEAAGIGRIVPKSPQGNRGARAWLCPASGNVAADDVVERADKILSGLFDVFSMRDAHLGFPPEWNRDPRTGTRAPMSFGKLLNYRDESLVGDIKYLWEPNRHLELVVLAQAFELRGEVRHASGARVLLESWFDQCPYPGGVQWTSSLEHAVRLMNWAVAWQLLERSGWLSAPEQCSFRGRWLGEIYRHQAFVAGHLSRHSSANNHLLGEFTGLFLAAITWPLWRESDGWLERAGRGLERETLLQNAPDGVNREQGLWYHHEVADMMLLATLAARAAGREFPAAWRQRLQDMLSYIASLMNVAGLLPMIGDSDDAVMVRLAAGSGFDVYRSLLASGAVLFGRGDLAAKAGRFDDKSRWLLGPKAEAQFERLLERADPPGSAKVAPRREFEHGGYWVLGDRLDEPDEVRIIADAGPLGYLSIAAHGHADALAFTLSCGGRELLIDPGTYAYHTQSEWRDYFKGTSAHNTLRIDGLDQSVSGGNFMWLRHAKARMLHSSRSSARDEWVAQHDGYCRLVDPVLHTRKIVFDKLSRELTVTDMLDCKATHEVEIFWHFAESCEVVRDGSAFTVVNAGASLHMSMPPAGGRAELVRGKESPPLGWVSRRFDHKVPSYTAVWRGQVSGQTTLTTQIAVGP